MLIRSKGSPPQVRGKLPPTKFGGDVYGITPAGAGKTEILSVFSGDR